MLKSSIQALLKIIIRPNSFFKTTLLTSYLFQRKRHKRLFFQKVSKSSLNPLVGWQSKYHASRITLINNITKICKWFIYFVRNPMLKTV